MNTFFRNKSNFKSILSVALSICMVVSLILPITRMVAFADNTPEKMLHVQTTEGWKEFYQKAPVEAGKTYHFAFSASSDIAFTPICVTDNDRVTVNANIQQAESTEKGGYTNYVYSYTIPSVDANNRKITEQVFFGIAFTSARDGYFFNASVYATDDADKTELLTNPDFSSGALDDWAWGWDNWFGVWGSKGTSEWSNSTTTLTIVDYDESLFKSSSDESVKMMYINTSAPQDLMHRAKVEAGETYHFTFSLSDTFANHTVGCFNNWERNAVNTNPEQISKDDKGGYTTYTYSVTMPDTLDTDDDFLFFGINPRANGEGYLFNASVYKADDADKTQLLEHPDFKTGLTGWGWGWDVAWLEGTEMTNSSGTSTFKIVDFDESLFGTTPATGAKMLHVETTLSWKELYQKVAVEVGETYNFEFSVTSNVTFTAICTTDSDRHGANATIKCINKKENDGYTDYTYSYTIPATDETGAAMTDQVFIGIAFTYAKDGYFFNASVYNAEDADKTELLTNPDFSAGVLDDWAWGWDQWFGSWCPAGMSTWTDNSTTTLTVVDYDDSIFEPNPIKENKMLHVETTLSWKELYQKVDVEVGKTYHFKFSVSSNVFFTAICTSDSDRNGVNANIRCIDKKQNTGYVDYIYSYTIPATDETGADMTDQVFIGIAFTSAEDGYFFNASVYEADDADKTELLANPDFGYGVLDNWAWGWDQWFGSWCPAGMSEWTDNSTTTLTIVDYDESILETILPPSEKMLYFKTEEPNSLMQRAVVQAGQTYHFTFSLTKSIKNFKVTCFSDEDRYSVNAKMLLVDKVESDKYITYTYKYTIPEKDDGGRDITSKVFFGIQPLVACEGYLFDASVYNAADADKSELFENADFASGVMTHWAYGWDIVWLEGSEITSNSGASTFKVVDYDESLFPEVDDNTVTTMLNFISGATGSSLASRVNVDVGETYCIELKAYITGSVSLYFTEDDDRPYINAASEVEEIGKEGNVTTYRITFTVPERSKDGRVFVGPTFSAFSEGYVYDMVLYNKNDPMKNNMWENAGFEVGLDGWIWGWHEWFGVLCDKGIYEWTNGQHTLQLMDLDIAKIDKLVAEINVNDGEWWNDEDILEETVLTNATLQGTLVDQNNAPLSGVALALVSEEKTYNATTNSKGEFIFKDFLADFYELYVINQSGEKTTTNFFSNFYGGDTVTLELVCDTSKAEAPVISEEVKNNVGSLEGTVYTPTLETVANIKVYMRGVGETVTDANGHFAFADVAVGEYELYTVLDDGTEYVFRKATVKENVNLSVKLKYDVAKDAAVEDEDGFNWLLVIIPCVIVVIIAAGIVVFLVIKKKKNR